MLLGRGDGVTTRVGGGGVATLVRVVRGARGVLRVGGGASVTVVRSIGLGRCETVGAGLLGVGSADGFAGTVTGSLVVGCIVGRSSLACGTRAALVSRSIVSQIPNGMARHRQTTPIRWNHSRRISLVLRNQGRKSCTYVATSESQGELGGAAGGRTLPLTTRNAITTAYSAAKTVTATAHVLVVLHHELPKSAKSAIRTV